jgi:peptide/histidine transporter 3/4
MGAVHCDAGWGGEAVGEDAADLVDEFDVFCGVCASGDVVFEPRDDDGQAHGEGLWDTCSVDAAVHYSDNLYCVAVVRQVFRAVRAELSSVSIAVAAGVEMRRLRVAEESGVLDSGQVPMSIFWLLPQYVLTGICEVFISVGQMEFFLDQAPDSMRSLGNALYLSTVAVGSFVSSLLVSIVTEVTRDSNGGWIGNNLNRSHMDYFYWLLAVLSFANTLVFVWCAQWYTYKSTHVRPSQSIESSRS